MKGLLNFNLHLKLTLASLALGVMTACSQHASTPAQAAPSNPPAAAKANVLRGYVVMRYSLNGDGHPIEIEVVESSPKGIFEAEAVGALSRWRYEVPVDEHNQPLKKAHLKVRLDFELDQSASAKRPNDQNTNKTNTNEAKTDGSKQN